MNRPCALTRKRLEPSQSVQGVALPAALWEFIRTRHPGLKPEDWFDTAFLPGFREAYIGQRLEDELGGLGEKERGMIRQRIRGTHPEVRQTSPRHQAPQVKTTDYSVAERLLWRGYLAAAAPLFLLSVMAIFFSLWQLLKDAISGATPLRTVWDQSLLSMPLEMWLVFSCFWVCWLRGAVNYRGLKKSWREYLFLLVSFVPLAAMGFDLINHYEDREGFWRLIGLLCDFLIFTPALFLGGLLGMRSLMRFY